jgi:putative oxidoreductase
MITAIRKVHAKNGPWVTDGGFEYNAVLIGAMAMLAENGPGALSVDEARFPRLHGPALAALSLGAAAVGSYLATSDAMAGGPAPAAPEGPEAAGDPASNGSSRFPEHASA